MEIVLRLSKLYLVAFWRKTKLFAGRLFWFWVTYSIGKALFDSDLAASILGGVVAVMTFYVGVTDEEVDREAHSVSLL